MASTPVATFSIFPGLVVVGIVWFITRRAATAWRWRWLVTTLAPRRRTPFRRWRRVASCWSTFGGRVLWRGAISGWLTVLPIGKFLNWNVIGNGLVRLCGWLVLNGSNYFGFRGLFCRFWCWIISEAFFSIRRAL
jgi:hypothetical protein